MVGGQVPGNEMPPPGNDRGRGDSDESLSSAFQVGSHRMNSVNGQLDKCDS